MGQRQWCRVRVKDPDGAVVVEFVLGGCRRPDLAAVDCVGRLALAVRRRGAELVLSEVSTDLAELLWLAALPVEVERQPEGGEQPGRVEEVEEEAHLGDPPA